MSVVVKALTEIGNNSYLQRTIEGLVGSPAALMELQVIVFIEGARLLNFTPTGYDRGHGGYCSLSGGTSVSLYECLPWLWGYGGG